MKLCFAKRASSIMEVLVALMVFAIVLATVIRIIGSARAIGRLSQIKQVQLDSSDSLLKEVLSGEKFVNIVLSDLEKQRLMQKLQIEDSSLPYFIKDKSVLNHIFQKGILNKTIKKDEIVFDLSREIMALNPWILRLKIFVKIRKNKKKSFSQPLKKKADLDVLISENMIPSLKFESH